MSTLRGHHLLCIIAQVCQVQLWGSIHPRNTFTHFSGGCILMHLRTVQPSKLSLCCAYCMFDGAHCILHPAAFTRCTLDMMFVCWFNGIIVMANTMLTMLMHILNYSIPPFLNIQSQERCFNFIFVLNFSLFSPLSPSNGDWISKCWIKFSQN